MNFKFNLKALGGVSGFKPVSQPGGDESPDALGDMSLLHHEIPADAEYAARKKAREQGTDPAYRR